MSHKAFRRDSVRALVHSFRRCGLLITTVVISVCASGASPGKVEMTRSDFTGVQGVRSTNVTFFGIGLGDSKINAKAAAAKAHLSWLPEEEFPNNVELQDADGETPAIIQIDEGMVSTMVLHRAASRYLAGNARKLFSADVVDADSPIRLQLLGREDKVTRTEDAASETITYTYDKEGFQLRCIAFAASGDVIISFHLIAPARSRR